RDDHHRGDHAVTLRPPRRPGFTLLEMLLASVIALLLLGALYVAMNMTVRQTQENRDAVDADHLAQSVFNRMTLDLGSTLGPLPPKSGGNELANSDTGSATAAAASGTTTTGTGTGTATDTTGMTTGTGTGTTDPNASTTTTNSVT